MIPSGAWATGTSPSPKPVHRLVVDAVHAAFGDPEDPAEPALRVDRHRMPERDRLRRHAGDGRVVRAVADVLVQGATKRDVERLHAPADPEEHNPRVAGGNRQRDVPGILLQVDLGADPLIASAVGGRRKVAAAGEHQRVHRGNRVGGGAQGRRGQDERDAA